MVRESRHLWVGNLPDNVNKERVKEYFNRYGPVQSVRVLPRREGRDGVFTSTLTVAFIDITSALKARNTEHKFEERILETDFYNPESPGTGTSSTLSHTEDKSSVQGAGTKLEQRSSHAYLRGPGPTTDKFRGGRYHDDYRARPRHQYRNQQFLHDSRNGVGGVSSYRSNYGWKERAGRTDQYTSDKLDRNKTVIGLSSSLDHHPSLLPHRTKKKRRKSRSSDSGSNSSGSGSGSRSSSSSSSRSSSSGSNSSKSRSPSRLSVAAKIKSSLGNYLPHTEFDKQCTIIVRNLPNRTEDGKLKDELHREYKRGGCSVRAVRIKTLASSHRVAIITFCDPADVSKALEDSRNKRIFGSLIEAEKLNNPHDERPRDAELSEFHSKATRTLHVGNISREVVPSQIHERFKEFGEILEIDIKKPDYALVQFVDIKSVVRAIRAVDGELIAGQRVRLAFGPSVATKCVWCDGVGGDVTEKMLQQEFAQFGKIQDLIIDRSRGHALVYFDQLKKATIAVTEMRGRSVCGGRLQTDYASHECRAAFFDHCKKSGMDIRERAKPWEQEQSGPADRRDVDRSDRHGRERSIDSRGSSVPRSNARRDDRASSASHRKCRDDYDEELRKFQSERGKFDDSDRCFTPPHRRPPPPVSRSPSPPTRLGRSPGAHSRSSGYEMRNDGRTFSDRDSVVSDGSRQGSPSRDSYRVGRYKPRTQAISPPASEPRHGSPAHIDDYDRRRRFRGVDGGGDSGDFRSSRMGSVDRSKDRERPTDPRVIDQDNDKKNAYKLAGLDSGLSEDTSSGSSGSVPDVDNAKLLSRVSAPPRRISTDSAVSRSSHVGTDSRPPSPSLIPVYAGGPSSLLRVMSTLPHEPETGGGVGFGAPRTPSSPPPPDSDGSRPGTPLCDENPENLMCRPTAGPVRLSSHLRTSSTSEPMSLPLPLFAQDVLSTSSGDRRSSTERLLRPNQISPRDPILKQGRPDLAKLSIVSPTKYGNSAGSSRDPRLKSPSVKSPSVPVSSASSSTSAAAAAAAAGYLKQRVSPSVPAVSKTQSSSSCASPDPVVPGSLMVKVNSGHVDVRSKDPRLMTGLLTVAVPSVVSSSPASPSPASRTAGNLEDNKGQGKNLDERIKSLNEQFEQYEKWSGSVRVSGSTASSRSTDSSLRFNLDMKPSQPSAIVQKLLSRKSVFDDDSKRLENQNEKYEVSGEEQSPEGLLGVGYKPAVLDSPLFPAVSQFTSFPPVPPNVSTVMSTVSTPTSTRVSTSPHLSRSSTPHSPSTPLSPRGSALSSRLYFPPPSPLSAGVKPVEPTPRLTEDFSSPKQIAGRPLPLPNKAGTAATTATVPIKPLIDKLGKPAAFTKPSATVTPTLKSTGMTASTVRPILSTIASTKTISTSTMVPSAKPPAPVIIPAVEKGEASSTTCSPKLDAGVPANLPEPVTVVQDTDSDPNVTSTTKDPGVEAKKKLDIAIPRDPIKVMKKEIDSLSFRDKKDIKEELLFAPTVIQTKTKHDKLNKKFDIMDTISKDGKKSKDCSSVSKDKSRSNKDSQKHKQKLKHKNDLKDFLSATATIRKETSRKEEKKPVPNDKDESKKVEETKEKKRRLSSNSEIEESEPKPKQAKLKHESDGEPETKKHRSESSSKVSMGRIPKIEKSEKSEHRKESSKHKHLSSSSSSSSSSKSKSKHESEKHRHKSEKKEDRDKDAEREKLKKKKSSKHDEERSRRHEKLKSTSMSTDDEKVKKEKEMKKVKDLKKKDEKERKDSEKDKDKDKERREKDREHKSKDSKDKYRDKDRDKEKERLKEKEKERERKERKRKKEEERKKSEQAKKKKKLDHETSSDEDGTSDDSKPKFSIFDEPIFDEYNPIYSMYDKVKARRSCVKAREEEEARKQQEALEKFSKLKAQRAKREEKKMIDSSDDLMSDGGKKNLSSGNESETRALKKKSNSLLVSSSENEESFQVERRRKKKSSSAGDKKKSGLSKKTLVDSTEDSDNEIFDKLKKPSNGLVRSKPASAIYSSDDEDIVKTHKKTKLNIYTDSESNTEHKTEPKAKKTSKLSTSDETKPSISSDSESEPGEPKSSALAVLTKGKKKSPVKDLADGKKLKTSIKLEPFSSEPEQETKILSSSSFDSSELKDFKTEIKSEPLLSIKTEDDKGSKKKSIKKEKKRDKEPREKEKSVLGQKMAKIFGTSSEDESFGRNTKPPTPNTSLSKQVPVITKPVVPKLSIDQVFSASDGEKDKMLDSPALMSDSDDDVRSRPPTPTFQTKKVEESKTSSTVLAVEETKVHPTKSQDVKQKEKSSLNLFDSSEDEMSPGQQTTSKDQVRSRNISAHDRQKESENLFDSLLTVNVDFPGKMPRKSPGSAKSPGSKSGGKSSESQKSPGSHRSPLISPSGKPTYLLAHAFNKAANREAEKRHKEQEIELSKSKSSDRKETIKEKETKEVSKDTFKDLKTSDKDSPEAPPAVVTESKETSIKEKMDATEPAVDVKKVADEDSSEIKILEEKVKIKPTIIEPVPKEEKECEILSVKDDDLKVKSADSSDTIEVVADTNAKKNDSVEEKPVTDKDSPSLVKETRKSVDSKSKQNSSSESGYDLFAQGNLDATSSPSPGSDYEEGRLVIGEGDEINSDNEVVAEEPSKSSPASDSATSEEPEIIAEHVNAAVEDIQEIKVNKVPEPTDEEQLEKSIASITSEMETSEISTSVENLPQAEASDSGKFELVKDTPSETEPPVKRTVISQEETESAVNALLGESFDSFDTEDPNVPNPPQTVEETIDTEPPAAVLVDDEAAAAVAGLGFSMSPTEQISTNLSPPQEWSAEDQSKAPLETDPASEPENLANKKDEKSAVETPETPAISKDEQKPEVVPDKPSEAEMPLEEMVVRGRGRGRGSHKRGRGSNLLTQTPTLRGRGRGSRINRGQVSADPETAALDTEKTEVSDTTQTPRGRGRGRGLRGIGRELKKVALVDNVEDKSHDVFEFKESDEELSKEKETKPSTNTTDESDKEAVDAEATSRTSLGRGRGKATVKSIAVSSTAKTPTVLSEASTSSPSVSATTTTTTSTVSPVQPLPVGAVRLSTDEKMSPTVSPGSVKSPRMRRSTGGKSRESEEESADTDQKIKLILEQAKQEAAQQAAAHHLVSMPGFALTTGIPMTAGNVSSSQGPLISPQSAVQAISALPAVQANTIKTGIPQPTVLPPRHDQQVRPQRSVPPVRPSVTVSPLTPGPRAPVPIQLPTQPLPPESVRKTQPVLLEQNQPVSKISTGAPIPRTTLSVSLPTEPIPRSVAMPVVCAVLTNSSRLQPLSSPAITTPARTPSSSSVSTAARVTLPTTITSLQRLPVSVAVSNMAKISISSSASNSTRLASAASLSPVPRVPLASANVLVSSRAAPTTSIGAQNPSSAGRQQIPVISRSTVPVSRPAPTEGQRVSLKQREGTKEQELDQKGREQVVLDTLLVNQQGPVKREYLQPREQETLRPSSTPQSSQGEAHGSKEDDKAVYNAAHQQPYDPTALELVNRNYRELSYIYNQLISAGHPEPVAIQYAQSLFRDRLLEESRPGSVPPMPHLHHLEEERREPLRQPLPAHTGPYRQTDSPIYHHLPPAHSGSQHPYLPRDPAAHLDPFRREELVPPAAHSSQIKRLTHSTGVTDFSTSKPSGASSSASLDVPASISTNYRMPHLAAYPICWSGILGLKNDMANVQMHYVSGCRDLAREYLPQHGSNLKIVQRMRLEDAQIDGVKKKMDTKSEHCMLLALPHGSDQEEIEKQSKILRNNFITYLQLKTAAGIANVVNEDNQPAIVHVFPSCDFANENLARIAPNLLHRVADIEHLVIVIATVFNDANK